jgi:hypothetical protein
VQISRIELGDVSGILCPGLRDTREARARNRIASAPRP